MEDNFDGVKVMVIDDSKTIRRTAETLLSKAGCEVITAIDGLTLWLRSPTPSPQLFSSIL